MTKQQHEEVLFSLQAVEGYIKNYAIESFDYDQDHILNHLKKVLELVEKDKRQKLIVEIMHEDEDSGLYDNDITETGDSE